VAALSYDSPEVLSHFAGRMKITYPMLSDPDSTVIKAFGLLNETVPKGTPFYGVPWPASYLIGPDGAVKARYFEKDYKERYTAGTVLLSISPDSREGWREAKTKHLTLRWRSADSSVRGGSRTALLVEVSLPRKMHVYAPGVGGSYIPIRLNMEKSEVLASLHEAEFPRSKTLHLKAIKETVPVYEGTFRISQDVTFVQQKPLLAAAADGKVTVKGEFRYQACDDKQCFPPPAVPLEWSFTAQPHDSTRVSESLRRK